MMREVTFDVPPIAGTQALAARCIADNRQLPPSLCARHDPT